METNGGDEQQIIAATESVEKTLESLDPSQQQAILLKLLGNSAAAGFTDGAFASLQALVTNEQTRRQQSSYAETVETSHAAEIAQIDATIVQRGIYGKFNAGVSMHGQQLVTANSIDFTAYPESFDIRRDQNQPIRDITNLQNALKESAHQPEIRAMLKNHFFIRMPYDAENEIVDIFFWSDHVDTVGGRNRPTGYRYTLCHAKRQRCKT